MTQEASRPEPGERIVSERGTSACSSLRTPMAPFFVQETFLMAQPMIVGDGGNGKLMTDAQRSDSRPPESGAVQRTAKAKPVAKTAGKTPVKREAKKVTRPKGLSFERHFTRRGADPLDEIVWERRSSVINNPDGSVVFKMEGAEIPASWSQLATDIVVSKYFRKAGIHGNKDVGETSVREVIHRLAKTIREAGDSFGGYFANAKEADTFEAELAHMLVNQQGAFNSPVWFNCGLWHRYGIQGTAGNYAWTADPKDDAGRRHDPRDRTRLRAPAVLGLFHPIHRATT
jgi:ribonucleoside-diphosphate reductase alpha chain